MAGNDLQRTVLVALNTLHSSTATLLKETLEHVGDARALQEAGSELPVRVAEWCALLLDISNIQGTAEPVVMNTTWKAIVLLLRTHRDGFPAAFDAGPFVDSTFAELSRCAHLIANVRLVVDVCFCFSFFIVFIDLYTDT
jgi:hypothetical protein